MYGIIGKVKVCKFQCYEINEKISEFWVVDYVIVVCNYFGISREEVENLMMIEFQLMFIVKYLDQKGYIREEYDDVVDVYFVRCKWKQVKVN